MRKFVPIFSIVTASVFMQNCIRQDEDSISAHNQSDHVQKALMMRRDSAKSSEQVLYPDPPVRDGDNWRRVQDNQSIP